MFPQHRQQALEMEKQQQLKKTQQNGERARSPNNVDSATKKSLKSSDGVRGKTKKGKRKTFAGYKDIVRDRSGLPKMPLCLGELTVECLGSITPSSPYVTEKHVWSVGFKSYRYFSSMVNPEIRVKYTSEIVDGGDKPQFMVTADDDHNSPIISYSPSGAWRTVLKRVMAKNGSDDSRKNISVSGSLRFGLAHPIVSHLIRELPNIDNCKDLIGSWSSSPSNSPRLGKRSSSEEEYSDSEDAFEEETTKKQKIDYDFEPFTSTLFSSKKEMEDLETAVATLQALKYCAVY